MNGAATRVGAYFLSHFGHHPHELVFGNRSSLRHRGMWYTKGGVREDSTLKTDLKVLMKHCRRSRHQSSKFRRIPWNLFQLDQITQLCYALECYNMNAEGEDGDPRKINIPEVEGHHEI